jgi:hypothetical protein
MSGMRLGLKEKPGTEALFHSNPVLTRFRIKIQITHIIVAQNMHF